jgi:hypothetical protein
LLWFLLPHESKVKPSFRLERVFDRSNCAMHTGITEIVMTCLKTFIMQIYLHNDLYNDFSDMFIIPCEYCMHYLNNKPLLSSISKFDDLP